MKRKIHINFSDFWHPDTLEAKLNNPLYKLLSERFDLVICDSPDFLLFSSFGVNFIRHSGVRIFYTGENVRPNYSLCDWSFGFDYSDDPRHFRLPYYAIWDLSPLLQSYDTEVLIAQKNASVLLSTPIPRRRSEFNFLINCHAISRWIAVVGSATT